MKRIISFICLTALFLGANTVSAQNNYRTTDRTNYRTTDRSNYRTHNNEIGVRLGPGGSITYKHYTGVRGAFEIMADITFAKPSGIYLTGLYEWNHYLGGNAFSLYYGLGAHIGAYSKEFAAGVDGIIGVQYKFPNAPIALSIDWKPQFNIVPDTDFYAQGFALGIKYAF